MTNCGGSPSAARRARFYGARLLVPLVVLLFGFAFLGGSAFGTGTKPSITVLNDANHDGTYSAVENVAKNATYPSTVTYELTINDGDFHAHDPVASPTTRPRASPRRRILRRVAQQSSA